METCVWRITPEITCGDPAEESNVLCEFHFNVVLQLAEDMGLTPEDFAPPNGVEWTVEDVRKMLEDQ